MKRMPIKAYIAIVVALISTQSFSSTAFTPLPVSTNNVYSQWQARKPELLIELGGFFATQGQNNQMIAIEDLKGNQYTVTNGNSSSGIVGLGYYMRGWSRDRFDVSYGLNTFYFAPSSVSGYIVEEMMFTNLAYKYDVNHFPLYVAAKGKFNNSQDRYALVFDAGIGPNFTRTRHYQEQPRAPMYSVNNSFSGASNVTFSAMAGIGFRINRLFGSAPLECGYRFFYLGQDALQPTNDQILTRLSTGENYAQAIMCGLVI